MCNKIGLSLVLASMTWLTAREVPADIPAPPVNQWLGMRDVLQGSRTEAECRVCHSDGLPNRHHMLYGKPIPLGSQVPYPDGDGNGIPDSTYSCVSCHGTNFAVVRNCVVCHTTSPHHATAKATSGDCKACHGSIVDNRNDGHFIPTYAPSRTTPRPSRGYALPLNSRRKGAGACDYCHDSDNSTSPPIATNSDLHHATNLDCTWCHDLTFTELAIRVCENCHGPDSLHSIQADSPAPGNRGTIVGGGEEKGYGHIGRDAGPGDSDCWGCHGFAGGYTPGSGPVVPTVQFVDRAVATAGIATSVILSGASFVNSSGGTVYQADVALTAANGSSLLLTPDVIIDEGMLAVTIPANTLPGNYHLRASKAGLASNAAAISLVPRVKITRATAEGRTVTITGAGFGGHAAGSGTTVTGTTTDGRTVRATIVSWKAGKIIARFGSLPVNVTVRSVFGKATSKVSSPTTSPPS